MLRILLLLVLALSALPAAAQPIALHCARGTPDYPDADLTLSAGGSHVVQVVFVGYRPSRVRADWSLRDCLYTASRLDSSRDIAASLWYRERGTRSRQPLQPFAAVFKASSKSIVVQRD